MISYTGDMKHGIYTTAPLGWLLCDFTNIPSQYAALIAKVGAKTPDCRGKATVGTGSGFGLGDTGGATQLTLSEAQMPQHGHPFTGTNHTHPFAGANHTHPFSPGSHGHTGTTVGTLSSPNVVTGTQGTTGWRAMSSTGVVGFASQSGTVGSAAATGTVSAAAASGTVGNAGSGDPINVQSPYTVALAIIKT